MTSDGKPYGPFRYKQIVQECYLISKNMNTSYTEVRDTITPIERKMMLEFLNEEAEKVKKSFEEHKKKQV